MQDSTQQSFFKSQRLNRVLLASVLGAAGLLTVACSSTSVTDQDNQQGFMEKRAALIAKYSAKDGTFAALQAQADPKQLESREYWRWRIDQYMYGQYPEYQALYDTYTQGKSFQQIYDLPAENLGPKKPLPSQLPKLPSGYFSDNLQGNPHTGEYNLVGDKVYITYQGHLTDPYIASFDLKTQQWQGPYKAAESTLSKGERKIDSHGRPLIEQDALGHFHIIYGGHGGEREDGLNPYSIDTPHAGGRMLHVMSAKPNDISQFVPVNDITPFASYTASEKMDNGDIYFFTRAGTHKSPWIYYKMKNGQQRFEPPVTITWPTPQKQDPIHVDTFYIKPRKVSATDIVISSLWHTCNFNEIHDKTTYGRINTYYMRLDTTTDTFYNAQNEPLTLPITLASANKKTLAFDSTQREETPFSTMPLILDDKKPAVAYQARAKNLREWRMTKFDNGQWQHSLPMPGTTNRVVVDSGNQPIKNIITFEEVNGQTQNTALVLYKDKKGQAIFATATKQQGKQNTWRIKQQHAAVAKARMELQAVKNKQGEIVAAILNIRKGGAQRLYLWQNGQFKTPL
ncbi:hypothetical protein C2869_03520 [Saccharobesus litoralis]|uniref:BNR repeat-containing family member n=1 Tax=Saccharobesus litoralis TaxID=2172099 RepID=A0A2S0VN99_9ALTE|nr:hypothetical protein [Saccharobesus litoralis]AWB65560.1 hypothetical protein C2869_03520 [Saccharobesus litoralis]